MSISTFRPFAFATLVLCSGSLAFAAEPVRKDDAAKLDEYQVGGNKKVKKDQSAVAKVERPKLAVDAGVSFDKPVMDIAPMVVAPMQVAPPAPASAAPAVAGAAVAKPAVAKPAVAKPATTVPKPQASAAGSVPVLPVAPKPQAAPTGALPQTAGGSTSGEPALVAISTPAPEYPREASMAGTTGFVVVAFTLNVQGTPQDISIVESSPPRVFDQSARRAVARWRFQPVVVNGQAVERKVQRRIDFK